MTKYSGRTSAYAHKFDDWAENDGPFDPAITQMTVFNAQWTDCPVEVESEVKKLWRNMELGNDNYYHRWNRENDHYVEKEGGGYEDEDSTFAQVYPLIDEYLMSKGITSCLIHWWW